MTPWRYIGGGAICTVVGVLMLIAGSANDDFEDSIDYAERTMGSAPSGSDDWVWNLIGVGFLGVGLGLVLIGIVGAGVRARRR
jgi:hypothetical protein